MNLRKLINYGLTLLFVLLLISFTFVLTRQTQYIAATKRNRIINQVNLVSKILYADGLQMGQATRNILLNPENKLALKNYKDAAKDFSEKFLKLKPLIHQINLNNENDIMTLIDKIQEHYTKDFEVQLDLHNLAFNGKTVIGIKRLNDEETPLWRDTKGDLLQLGTITNELAKAEDKLADELTRQIESLWIVLYCFVLLSSICSLFFFTKILKNLRSQLKNLIQVVHETKETSLLINQTSEELTSGVTEQVSAIQETSASLNEISAMISKNTESSQLSLKKIMTSQESINLGKSAVNRMVNVVEIINQAGGEIVNDVENSNAEIENITKIIAKISDKTKVINDIAFQTKLLSFNASVEASRAGEHGKGFSVVAEEISNLAEVSAKSAKEIVELLNYSDNEVKNIKAKSLSNLNDIIERNQKISVNVASSVNECSQAFDQIIKDIDVINSITQEVVSASLEQSEGIEEVTKAMHQINQVTEHSSSMAQQSSNIAGKLKMESDKVYSTADNLSWLIDGESR